jgi:squalene cyclase
VQDEVDKAVAFLISEFARLGDRFFDISVVGTGHRGVLYLQYPSYAFSFPLIALSRYRAHLANSTVETVKGFL